jgi:hypothetical protein
LKIKKKKNFWSYALRQRHRQIPQDRKFFGSLFQKITVCFLYLASEIRARFGTLVSPAAKPKVFGTARTAGKNSF